MVFTNNELTPEKIFDEDVIIDLSRVGSSETKALIMGILVLKLQEYRMSSAGTINRGLQHLTIVEEAHHLLRAKQASTSSEGADIQGKSVEMISNAIAEMRTYGEGFVIVDQAPGLLDMSVIRNTNTKIIMRLPDKDDRELVGRAANLNDDQILELAKLPCGVAAVYQNDWVQPVLCQVDYEGDSYTPYHYSAEGDIFADESDAEATEMLLTYIMHNGLERNRSAEELANLKSKVLLSHMDALVKTEFLEYVNSNEEKEMETLRRLLFDLLNANEAMEAARDCNEVVVWLSVVVEGLKPSIRHYTNKQVNMALALLVYEKAQRDAAYHNLFSRFTEVYQEKGRVI